MNDNAQMSIIRELMFSFVQSSEWNQIECGDPMICKSERRIEETKRRIMGQLSVDDENDLSETIQGIVDAYTTAAILFGMRTANALREATARPAALSRYNLDCLIALEERAEQHKKAAKAS